MTTTDGARLPAIDDLPLGGVLRVERPPLVLVVCELRFPPLIALAREAPAAFQEKIYASYPDAARAREPLQKDPAFVAGEGRVRWDFADAAGEWVVSVRPYSLGLETRRAYVNFADLWARMSALVESFLACYPVPHFVRAGLRYGNELRRPDDRDAEYWIEGLPAFFHPSIRNQLVSDTPFASIHELRFQPEPGRNLMLKWGYRDNRDAVPRALVLDLDGFNTGTLPWADVPAMMSVANDRLTRLFYWCLEEPLRRELGCRIDPGPR